MRSRSEKTVYCKPQIKPANSIVPLDSLVEVVARKSLPAVLGGNHSVDGQSIFAAEPVEVFEFSLEQDEPFDKLSSILSKYQLEDASGLQSGLFCGGWIGFFGYELGRFIEKLPARVVGDLGFPIIRLCFYDKAILYDHHTEKFSLLALECCGQDQPLQEKFLILSDWLEEAKKVSVTVGQNANLGTIATDTVESNMTKPEYLEAIAKIKHYITEGETYQINFSQRFERTYDADPVDMFHWQNRFNPSPFSAFLAWEDRAVVSVSPELFLKVNGDSIATKPIKGTRARNSLLPDEKAENSQLFHDLVVSEKDQAELAMIVDLERNDLAKVCVPGTRHVSCAREIVSFPTVYHAVATVEGQLISSFSPQRMIDILKAAFPGGSITGAPKIRSMEIIDELEPTARSVYTGSIGWIGINGDMCFNIAIRTILVSGHKAYVQCGGGVVADSIAEAEWKETLTKAHILLAGIDAVNQARSS
jgi:para-aminobenzoate synthetase component 1